MLASLILVSCGSRRPSTVRDVGDVEGKTIGVLRGSAAAVFAASLGTTREYDSGAIMLGDLSSGALDCAVVDAAAASELLKSVRGIRALDEPLVSARLGIAAAKEAHDLTIDINTALDTLRTSKTLGSITEKYILGRAYEYIPRDDIPENAGSLRLAVRGDFPPYCVADGDTVTGLDIDVARAVCDILGVRLEITMTEASELISSVWTGRADLGMGGLYEELDEGYLVDFSESYASFELVVLTRR
ncbi:MAG: transporter substrate-binding domain-containing protein [Oscillospiraceae bacterium]|nr:transporter substrate-binding domain-containing protein [Oscillospiraceae bacterium]